MSNFHYKLQEAIYGPNVSFADHDLGFDEGRMSAWIIFADGNRRDGVGDLLEIDGIDTSRHRRNPVVLSDHAKLVTLPVALAEDPQTKQYTVVLDPIGKQGRANCFFYQGKKSLPPEAFQSDDPFDMEVMKTKEYDHALYCEQLYDLLVKRFIRGGSIGYQVQRGYQIPADYQKGIPQGTHLQNVLMLECSIVTMPCNADTVVKVLSMPKVCGKPLSPMLVKSLSPYAPPKKAMMGYEGGKDIHVIPNIPHQNAAENVQRIEAVPSQADINAYRDKHDVELEIPDSSLSQEIQEVWYPTSSTDTRNRVGPVAQALAESYERTVKRPAYVHYHQAMRDLNVPEEEQGPEYFGHVVDYIEDTPESKRTQAHEEILTEAERRRNSPHHKKQIKSIRLKFRKKTTEVTTEGTKGTFEQDKYQRARDARAKVTDHIRHGTEDQRQRARQQADVRSEQLDQATQRLTPADRQQLGGRQDFKSIRLKYRKKAAEDATKQRYVIEPNYLLTEEGKPFIPTHPEPATWSVIDTHAKPGTRPFFRGSEARAQAYAEQLNAEHEAGQKSVQVPVPHGEQIQHTDIPPSQWYPGVGVVSEKSDFEQNQVKTIHPDLINETQVFNTQEEANAAAQAMRTARPSGYLQVQTRPSTANPGRFEVIRGERIAQDMSPQNRSNLSRYGNPRPGLQDFGGDLTGVIEDRGDRRVDHDPERIADRLGIPREGAKDIKSIRLKYRKKSRGHMEDQESGYRTFRVEPISTKVPNEEGWIVGIYRGQPDDRDRWFRQSHATPEDALGLAHQMARGRSYAQGMTDIVDHTGKVVDRYEGGRSIYQGQENEPFPEPETETETESKSISGQRKSAEDQAKLENQQAMDDLVQEENDEEAIAASRAARAALRRQNRHMMAGNAIGNVIGGTAGMLLSGDPVIGGIGGAAGGGLLGMAAGYLTGRRKDMEGSDVRARIKSIRLKYRRKAVEDTAKQPTQTTQEQSSSEQGGSHTTRQKPDYFDKIRQTATRVGSAARRAGNYLTRTGTGGAISGAIAGGISGIVEGVRNHPDHPIIGATAHGIAQSLVGAGFGGVAGSLVEYTDQLEEQQSGEDKKELIKSIRLKYRSKSLTIPHAKASYFQNCPRDETGHCLPKGSADRHKPKDDEGKGKQRPSRPEPEKIRTRPHMRDLNPPDILTLLEQLLNDPRTQGLPPEQFIALLKRAMLEAAGGDPQVLQANPPSPEDILMILRALLGRFSDQALNEISVWFLMDGSNQTIVDVFGSGSTEIGKRLVSAIAGLVGKEATHFTNQGVQPQGQGWVLVEPLRPEMVQEQPEEQPEEMVEEGKSLPVQVKGDHEIGKYRDAFNASLKNPSPATLARWGSAVNQLVSDEGDFAVVDNARSHGEYDLHPDSIADARRRLGDKELPIRGKSETGIADGTKPDPAQQQNPNLARIAAKPRSPKATRINLSIDPNLREMNLDELITLYDMRPNDVPTPGGELEPGSPLTHPTRNFYLDRDKTPVIDPYVSEAPDPQGGNPAPNQPKSFAGSWISKAIHSFRTKANPKPNFRHGIAMEIAPTGKGSEHSVFKVGFAVNPDLPEDHPEASVPVSEEHLGIFGNEQEARQAASLAAREHSQKNPSHVVFIPPPHELSEAEEPARREVHLGGTDLADPRVATQREHRRDRVAAHERDIIPAQRRREAARNTRLLHKPDTAAGAIDEKQPQATKAINVTAYAPKNSETRQAEAEEEERKQESAIDDAIADIGEILWPDPIRPRSPSSGTKGISSIRQKYRGTGGRAWRVKNNAPGVSMIYVDEKDLERLQRMAKSRGVELDNLGAAGSLIKMRARGIDREVDFLAKMCGKEPEGGWNKRGRKPQMGDLIETKAKPSERADAPSPAKARQILRDGEVQNHPLTEKQRGFFGAVAGQDEKACKELPELLDSAEKGLDELKAKLANW